MREYKFKRGFKPSVERLEDLLKKHFGDFDVDGGVYKVKFGAIKEMKLWIENKKLCVESKTDPSVSNDVAVQTLKTYNRFLEELTGYTAKERAKIMKKDVEKS